MRQHGLCAKGKRRGRPITTRSASFLPAAANHLAHLPPAQAPGERFHSDIAYIPTKEGFLYLAATLDAFTRRCAGWCARDNMEVQLVNDAARMAFGAGAGAGVHHSDRGSQYAGESFRLLLEKQGLQQSMSPGARLRAGQLLRQRFE